MRILICCRSEYDRDTLYIYRIYAHNVQPCIAALSSLFLESLPGEKMFRFLFCALVVLDLNLRTMADVQPFSAFFAKKLKLF